MDKELIDYLKSLKQITEYNIPKSLVQEIYQKTLFLDEYYDHVPFSQRVYHIKNNDCSIHYCEICRKPLDYMVVKKRYPKKNHASCISKRKSENEKNKIELFSSRSEDEKMRILKEISNEKLNPHSKLKSQKLEDFLMDKTSFLDKVYDHVTIGQRLWHIRHDFYDVVYCEICGKPKKFGYDTVRTKYKHTKKLEPIYKVHTECLNQKIKLSFKEKYPNKAFYEKIIQKKSQKTMIEKYGVNNFSKTDNYKEIWEQSQIKKYGKIYSHTDEFILKIEDNFKNTTLKRIEQTNNNITYIGYNSKRCHNFHCNDCNNDFQITTESLQRRLLYGWKICNICNPEIKSEDKISCGEKEIRDFISKIYSGKIVYNTREIVSPRELDIYLPELKLAIEFNGIYWHSSKNHDKNYHKLKTDICKEKGIRLIHIFDYHWFKKRSNWMSFLQNQIIQKSNYEISFNDCMISKINDIKTINDFIDKNDLSEKITNFTICYGLYHLQELISIIILDKEKELNYKMTKIIIKDNFFIRNYKKFFIHILQKENINNVIYFNNRAIYDDALIRCLGFKCVKTTDPNCFYIDRTNDKISTNLKELKSNNIIEIFDSGSDIYLLDKENIKF